MSLARFQITSSDYSDSFDKIVFPYGVDRIIINEGNCQVYLSNEIVDEISAENCVKKVRLITAFSVGCLYSEDYEFSVASTTYHMHGHDQRKTHKLSYRHTYPLEKKRMASQLLNDMLHVELGDDVEHDLLNLIFIWNRASELMSLHLAANAYSEFWRVLDYFKKQTKDNIAKEFLKQNGIEFSKSRCAATQVVLGAKNINPSVTNIETISQMMNIRHPHAHGPNDGNEYWKEEDSDFEANINLSFLKVITKYFIVNNFGYTGYSLKRQANIYVMVHDSLE